MGKEQPQTANPKRQAANISGVYANSGNDPQPDVPKAQAPEALNPTSNSSTVIFVTHAVRSVPKSFQPGKLTVGSSRP